MAFSAAVMCKVVSCTEASECIAVNVTCREALTVHMTSLECNTDDELESTVGDLDEATDTETESISDGRLSSYMWAK